MLCLFGMPAQRRKVSISGEKGKKSSKERMLVTIATDSTVVFFQAVGWVISCDTGKGIAPVMLFGDSAYILWAVRIGLLITTCFKVPWLSFDSG